MKVLYSPAFSGHVFLGLQEKHSNLMDTMVCDTTGLIGMLELRLGIHVEEQNTYYRTIKYFEAMSKYMKQHPNNALAESFNLSSLGTAEQALRWRDSLVLDNWQPDATSYSGRLDVLAGVEPFFDSPGTADRLKTVLVYINKEGRAIDDLTIEMPCEMDMLHPAMQELLGVLQKQGAIIEVRSRCGLSTNNLSRIAQLLQSSSKEKVALNRGDRSFQIYKFADEKAANEYLAMRGDELKADVWINDANKSLDNWLRMMGKPTMGSRMDKATTQLLQLFVLGKEMMKEPLNIQSIISWLYSPLQPLGIRFGSILAETIIRVGGYRNKECKEVVTKYIEGKYAYHDKEEDAKLTDQELAKRDEKERKERTVLIETYLPSFDVSDNTELETNRLKVYLNSLSDWARSRAHHFLSEMPENVGWCSQLQSLAQMCDTFLLLLESSGMGKTVDIRQVDSWISTLFKGEAFMQYTPQKGSPELIDHPAKMAAQSKRTIWMNFVGGEAAKLDCSFLYPSEREHIKDNLRLWDEHKEIAYHETMQLLPFFMTEEQLILVTTDYLDGQPSQKHPVMVRLEGQVSNLDDFIITPSLLKEEKETVRLVRNNNTQPIIHFDHADLVKWPDHLSPTSISTLVEYPLDYMMEKMLNIVSTGPSSIKELKVTKGTVAHAVIQSLFAPRDGQSCSKADEIEQRINAEFEEQFRKQIEACGAILYLPENRLEAELLKEQLLKCLGVLLEIIRDNHLSVIGCEQLVKMDMDLLPSDKDWDMIGIIDMTLEDAFHHPVVFDFKWTSSKDYYRNLLTANRSIQLELYRAMLSEEKKDAVERTAYFLMPECHLYSKEHFEGLHCTQLQPENNNNIVEQLKRSFFYRKKQIDNGQVEVDEGFPGPMLPYYNDTEAAALFPLKLSDGQQDKNKFSNYMLFKGLTEDEK